MGNYASLKEKLYCKPHFTQLFKAKGNLSAFGEPGAATGVVSSPLRNQWAEAAPVVSPPAPVAARRPEDFSSGFAPEYVPTKISRLGAGPCTSCKAKVFAVGKVEQEGRRASYLSIPGASCERGPLEHPGLIVVVNNWCHVANSENADRHVLSPYEAELRLYVAVSKRSVSPFGF